MSSFQEPARGSKAAKFVSANPLDPMIRPFSSNESATEDDLADRVNCRLSRGMNELQMHHAQGRNLSDHPDRVPTGSAYQNDCIPPSTPTMTSTDHVSNTPSSSNAYCDPSGRTAAPISPDEPNDSDSDAWFDEDEDDDPVLSALCERRLEELKRAAIKNANDLAKGHGEVRTISQDEFLPECCNSSEDSSSMSSEWVVVHFFHKDFQRCIIMDHHLKIVASQHTECKFLRIDAEKAPFFVKKLSIRILPTLLVMHHGVVADRLIGFTDLVPPASDESAQNGRYHSPGAQDEWKTSELQQWLSKCGAISYDKAKFDYENHSDDDEDEL